MDSYEECRDAPRVHLLDKFDIGGPGSCFRRYSDPTFFKRASADWDESYSEKTEKARKSRKNKKKRSSRRNGEVLRGEHMHSSSGRMQFISSSINGRTSSSQTASTIDMTMKSDLEHHSNSFDSRSGGGYIECVFHPSNTMQSHEPDYKELSSPRLAQKTNIRHSLSPHIDDSISHDSLEKQVASSSSGVTWDEKEEIVESKSQTCDRDKTPERIVENHGTDMHANEAVTFTNVDYSHVLFNEESNLKAVSNRVQTDDIDSEPDNYVDALNTIESESENDIDYETKREVQQFISHVLENGVTEASSNLFDKTLSDVSQTDYSVPLNKETGKDFPDSLQENHPLDLVSKPPASNLGSVSPSDVLDSKNLTRDSVSLNKETLMDLPDSLQEISPLTSESHASYLELASPSDVLNNEEPTRDTVSINKETFENLPNSLQGIPPVTSEPHASNLTAVSPSDVPFSEEMSRDTTTLNEGKFRNLPDSLQEIPPFISEPHASNLASLSSSVVSLRNEITKSIADSYTSETPACEQVPVTCGNSVFDHSVCADTVSSSAVNDTVSAPIETGRSFSDSKISNLPDEASTISNNICKNEETLSDSLADNSVRFWTNGGLLGLEPSKPPDFNKSTSLSQGSLSTKGEADGGSRHNSIMQESNGYKEERESSGEVAEQNLKEQSSKFLTSSHKDDQACVSEKTTGSSQQGFGQTERNSLGDVRVHAPGSALPAAAEPKDCTEPDHGNGENLSRVFGLSRRLLTNSFQRKVSFDEKSGHYNALKSVILEQSGQNGTVGQSLPETTLKEKVSSGYPINSLPPSPPLEHMKISFHPVSGLETSKLKLKFPDGSNRHESLRDMFPSFQLVPESSIPRDDAGSHSDDDDTFCRSSPYISDDDRHSPHSDYNSDQWESDETAESSDQGVHDSPHKRSSAESVSNDDANVKNGHGTYTTSGVEQSLSGPLLDFPSFDNVNRALERGNNNDSKCNNTVVSHSHAEPTPPPPPPLPTTEWRVSKPQLDMTNATQHFMSEDAENINDPSLLTIFQQPRFSEVEQIEINHNGHESYDNIICKLKEKPSLQLDRQKLNGQTEANHLRMGKETDEREDFLYQIRTKAFNLRPTVTGKSNDTTGPTANVKVTAILEKANAIRQVVASDDGEDDDNWSDT
ncbi:protein SCAR3 isoform X2 [Abrus precatorius]|nr:protein SCAR3 isoform X2 [Abrus precatorius]